MNYTKNCYKNCIDAKYLLTHDMLLMIDKILSKIQKTAKPGRPPIDFKRALNGIYYLLKTGVH